MVKGSFEGLYTFDQVAKIYNMDNSTLRKMVQANKFSSKDIKKFGKTWIITEQAIGKHFGIDVLMAYEKEEKLKELKELREQKASAIRNKKTAKTRNSKMKNDTNDLSSNVEDIKELGEIVVDPASIMQNFQF